MTTPAHGGQLRALAAAHHLHADAILDFSANINPDGPPASVLAALRQALDDPQTLTHYPDLALHDLRQCIAQHHTLAAGAIAIANGFVPLLEAALRAGNIRHCLLPVPAFSEYRRTLERCGIRVTPYLLQPFQFQIDPQRLAAAIHAAQADALLLANPQNPSGTLTPATTLRTLADAVPQTRILLDEAFIDYQPRQSLSSLAPSLPNLTVFRSVTKFFAMPGMRVAYAVSAPSNLRGIQHELPPWPVTTLAEHAVRAALAGTAFQQSAIATNVHRREALTQALSRLGIASHPAAANFLLLSLPVDAEALRHRLLHQHHIAVRSCLNFEALTGNRLRIAVRTEPENRRLIDALAALLVDPAPPALS